MKPFTYYLYHKPTGLHYYGARWAKGADPSQLWTTYFTSSPVIKNLIEQYGADSFEPQVRQVFEQADATTRWEHRVLTRIDAANNPTWINRHNGGNTFSCRGHSNETKERIRKKITGKKRSIKTCASISAAAVLREENKRKIGWTHPPGSRDKATITRQSRIDSGQINPYSEERNKKIAASKKGTKRQYLPNGSWIMIKSS